MSDETTLLPCPFCGGEAHMSASSDGYGVECWNRRCIDMQMENLPSEAEAIAAWNTRAMLPDDGYEAKMDALLCCLTNGKFSKSRAYDLDFMESCVREEFESLYSEEQFVTLGSRTCEVVKGEGRTAGWWVCKSCGCAFDVIGALACKAEKKPREGKYTRKAAGA